MATRKSTKKLREEQCIEKIRKIMMENTPKAIEKLYELLDDDEMTSSTKLSVIKEILERSIGKGQLAFENSENETLQEDKKFELTLKVVE